ncbi:TPA: transposase [Vibrio harveyi]|nr:transposase [Vibrio harveyi]
MLLAHKIELRPTEMQAEYLDRACGSKRHAFNQLLAHFSQDGVKWSKKAANEVYKQLRLTFPWYGEVSQRVTRNTIDDLDNAFKHFFRRVKLGEKAGYPTFKKRGVNDSFALREKEKFHVVGRTLRIEKLKAPIKMRQTLRFVGEARQVTISKRAGKYFASILVETQDYNPKDANRAASVGVDFGIKELATCSNGVVFAASQKLKASLNRLARKQRKLAKQVRGSNRYAKTKQSIAKLHKRITDQRQAIAHQVSDYLTAHFDRIVIEDLNVSGMVKNRKLARAVADCGFYMLRQQLEYKAALRNCELVVASRWFASSKICSGCGAVKKSLPLSERTYDCDHCSTSLDRDLNASINLNNYMVV